MQKLYSQNIRALPKVELHRHLDCSVRWSTLLEIAPQVGIELAPTYQGRKDQFLILEPMLDLSSVLQKFMNAQKVLASEEILTRIAFEACEDAFNDGVRLLELRYAPTFIEEGHSNLNFEKIHQALHKGIQLAQQKMNMAVGLICIIQRVKPLDVAEKVVDFAIDHKDSFIGLDLADNEDGFEPKKFATLFNKAKKAGLHITVHSGETPTDEAAGWVRDSIEILGAERIGHGVQIVRDIEAVELVRSRRIPLEICPISNYLTQAFATYKDHPLRLLLNAGVLITLNSDDPGIFATKLSDDYEIAHLYHGLTVAEFRRCNQVAFEASFIADSEKNKFRNEFF